MNYSIPIIHRESYERRRLKFKAKLNLKAILDGVFDINNNEELYEVLDEFEKNLNFIDVEYLDGEEENLEEEEEEEKEDEEVRLICKKTMSNNKDKKQEDKMNQHLKKTPSF